MAALELLRPDYNHWKEFLATEAMDDSQREYFARKEKVMARLLGTSRKKPRKVSSSWMKDVLDGPIGRGE